MARLSAKERASLPDTAFAYVDSAGTRRLPINDEPHVRNALARFGRVAFESEAARAAARRRLLSAAKRYGIVPIGFIDGELRSARRAASAGKLVIELSRIASSAELERELRRTLGDPELALLRWSKPEGTYVGTDGEAVALPGPGDPRETTFLQGSGRPLIAIVHHHGVLGSAEITEAVVAAVHLVTGRELLDEIDEIGVATQGLPEGTVTFLLTDIEGSTPLLHALGERYADVLGEVRAIIRAAVLGAGGRQVEARADEFVAVFEDADGAVAAAITAQRELAGRAWPDGHHVRVRIGVHTGDIVLTDSGYVGITVHAAARVMSAAHGGQILLTGATRDALADPVHVPVIDLGPHRLRGLADQHVLLQVVADGLTRDFPPPAI